MVALAPWATNYGRPPKLEPGPAASLARQLKRWDSLVEGLSHPDAELTIEEFAPVLATFRALQRLGATFDPMLVALMDIMERQALGNEAEAASPARPRPPRRYKVLLDAAEMRARFGRGGAQ